MSPPTDNLVAALPPAMAAEHVDRLLTAPGVRLERIVSHGQASPDGFWYDQDEAEWVMLLAGSAGLAIAGESGERRLAAGDAVFLPARCRHRVTWTDPARPTVWLALFVPEGAIPAPAAVG